MQCYLDLYSKFNVNVRCRHEKHDFNIKSSHLVEEIPAAVGTSVFGLLAFECDHHLSLLGSEAPPASPRRLAALFGVFPIAVDELEYFGAVLAPELGGVVGIVGLDHADLAGVLFADVAAAVSVGHVVVVSVRPDHLGRPVEDGAVGVDVDDSEELATIAGLSRLDWEDQGGS